MLDKVDYATIFQYCPRGISQTAQKARYLKDAIKGGRIESLKPTIKRIISNNGDLFSNFFNESVTLIPTPRSSLIRGSQLWPALEIAKMLESLKLGTVAPCLNRNTRIKSSSLYSHAEDRPSIEEQYNTMSVSDYIPSENITLIDDVITLGRTSFAAASRLAERFPNATVRIFALVQTKGLDRDIDTIENVYSNVITYNPVSGKCTRWQI